jgi:hypothetical protein
MTAPKRRATRDVEVARDPDSIRQEPSAIDPNKPPKGFVLNPGFPLFPRQRWPWIKDGFEPNYVRVYKIVEGQPCLAEWFKGDPASVDLDLIARMWGRGTYRVQLMSDANEEHGIERLFQNSKLIVERGPSNLPFPGPNRSPDELLRAAEQDVDEDDDEDDGNAMASAVAQAQAQINAAAQGGQPAGQAPAIGPFAGANRNQPPQQQKSSVLEMIAALTPLGVAAAGALAAFMEKSESREARREERMMTLLLGRQAAPPPPAPNDGLTEILKLMISQQMSAMNRAPSQTDMVSAITSEIRREIGRGNGGQSGLTVAQLQEAMGFLQKMPQKEDGGGGGGIDIGTLLAALGPILPTLLKLLGPGGAPDMPPQQQQVGGYPPPGALPPQ